MIITETKRLLITELSLADADFILALVNSPGWLAFIGDRGIKTREAAENYISKGPMVSYATFGHGLYLVTSQATGAAAGICGLLKRDYLEQADIGFAFLPEYTGNGYALEAAQAVVQDAKERLGINRIAAIMSADNLRSVSLLTKLGMLYTKDITDPGTGKELLLFTTSGI